jgi:hypothetical protein
MEGSSESKGRWLSFAGVGVTLALIGIAACAQGSDASGEQTPSGNTSEPDAASGGCKKPCKSSETCQKGVCVASDTLDADADGVGADKDCDDNDPSVHPGAPEVCNGKDDDCNGQVDDGVDADKDGFFACPKDGTAVDCDDTDPNVHPGATEVCNGKDDDCNGKVDEIPTKLTPTLTDSHWKVSGSAAVSGDWMQLTNGLSNQLGSLLWNAKDTFESFEMTASFRVDGTGDHADGLAFVWLSGTDVKTTTNGGNQFGLGSGVTGYAVVVDTYTNNEDSWTAPALLIVKANQPKAALTNKALPSSVLDNAAHTLNVVLSGGKVTASVDGTAIISNYTIAGYAPFDGYWGFTGATGGAAGAHAVKGITMNFPEGGGCVP